MPDLAFTLSDEFKKIRVKSDILPGSGIIYDLADLDVSYLEFLGATEGRKAGSKGQRPQYILTSGIRPEKEPSVESINTFYDKQTAYVSRGKGYLRTIRFRLLYARSNAQSRALKGLPTNDEPHPEPSTWLAVHEFEETPEEKVAETVEKDVKDASAAGSWGATLSEVHIWKSDRVLGEGKFFE